MHGSHGPFVVGAVIGLLVAMHLSPAPVREPSGDVIPEVITATTPDDGVVRIGVYDSRGVAIAWARSEFSGMRTREEAYRAAKAEGDDAEMHTQMKGHKPLDFATLFDMDPSH